MSHVKTYFSICCFCFRSRQESPAVGPAVARVTSWRAVRLRDRRLRAPAPVCCPYGTGHVAHLDARDANVTRHGPAVNPIGGVVMRPSPCCRRSRMLVGAAAVAEGGFRRRGGVASPILSGRGRPAAGTAGDRGRRHIRGGHGNRVHQGRCSARVRVVAVELRVLSLHCPPSPSPRRAAGVARGAMLRKHQF